MLARMRRLTSTKQINHVFNCGYQTVSHEVVVFVCPNPNSITSSWAVIAGKKVGNSVNRNRAKRIIRAIIYPLSTKEQYFGYNIVIVARQSLLNATYLQVQENMVKALNKAIKIANQNQVKQDSCRSGCE